jgi:hypothetical protein
MPENPPTAESIKKVERREKKRLETEQERPEVNDPGVEA